MVNVPHFDYPFRFGRSGSVEVIEQNSLKDVMNGVAAACKTTRGTRFFVPNFGIDDPTFQEMPLDETTLLAQIRESEPRADAVLSQVVGLDSDSLVDVIKAGVGLVE